MNLLYHLRAAHVRDHASDSQQPLAAARLIQPAVSVPATEATEATIETSSASGIM